MEINGACLCGDISWQATIDPALVGVCHCTDCQTVGGSAFQFTTRVAREDFHLTTGELAAYVKVAESGNPRAMSFCSRCATSKTLRWLDWPSPQSCERNTSQRGIGASISGG